MQLSSDLTGLLREFLSRQNERFPDIEAALDRYPPGNRMPLDEWWDWLDVLDARLKRPALGLEIGACLQLEHSGALGYLALSCSNIAEVMQRFERFQRLIYDGSHSSLVAGPGWVGLRWMDDFERISPRSDEVLFAGMRTFLAKVTGPAFEHFPAAFVHFHWPEPAHPEVYEAFFRAPVLFGQSHNTIAMPVEALGLPLASSDARWLRVRESQAEALLGSLPALETFFEKLQRAIMRALHQGEPSLDGMASVMNLSRRTLQRRLMDKGLSFREFLQHTREVLARQYLADPRLSLNEIAFLLGYSEQSAFQRAFREWTGQTPQRARARGWSAGPGVQMARRDTPGRH